MQDRRQIKNTDNTETKHNPEKANNTKHSKIKLPWFSCLLQQSTRKQVGLILYSCKQSWLCVYTYVNEIQCEYEVADHLMLYLYYVWSALDRWPAGTYGIPKARGGCPSPASQWTTGSQLIDLLFSFECMRASFIVKNV